jgi:hypothetical protein
LLLSVLSVKKFNPSFKCVFFVDDITYQFLKEKKWIDLWDEVKVIDFKNTEYGDLTKIHIYSWPKLYSYGLVDDDILVMDIDVVFVKPFNIENKNMIYGKIYNHSHYFKLKKKSITLRHKWYNISYIQDMLYENDVVDEKMEQDTICLQGSPIYCPKQYTKTLQSFMIDRVKEIESFFNGVCPNDTYQSIEEEYPLALFAKTYAGGFCAIDISCYQHGYVNLAKYEMEKGFKQPEEILGINVFDKYLKQNV